MKKNAENGTSIRPMNHFLHIITLLVVILAPALRVTGQPLYGTTGLLNIPTAHMQADGTVMVGFNWLPEELTPETFDYNTAGYYGNITFLPFFEFSYRMTLLKMADGNFNQDRSFAMRFRILRETKWLPSVVAGGNDLYSSSGKESGYFNALYVVASKNMQMSRLGLHGTTGFGHQGFGKVSRGNLKGFFGGIALFHTSMPGVKIIGEYDSRSFNTGTSLILFNHLMFYFLLYDMHVPAGGIALTWKL